MEIRAARPEEAEEILHVLCAAFRLPPEAARPIFYDDPFFDLSHKRVLRTAAHGIVSCLTVIPTRMRVGNAWIALGGIAGVATLPALQGQGHAGRLLAATVPALADELGYSLSGLFAVSPGLYRRFGWATATVASRASLPVETLTAWRSAGIVRPAGTEEEPGWAAVRALHGATASEASGRCLRDDRRWHLLRAVTGREWSVYQTSGQEISGYAVWDRLDGALTVREMRASTPDAAQGLLAYLARQTTPGERLEWEAPAAEVNALGLTNAEQNREDRPGLMVRVIDLAAMLNTLHSAHFAATLGRVGQSLTLRASDPLRTANSVPIRLTPQHPLPGSETDAHWIHGDVSVLSRICFGSCTPSEAAKQGLLHTSSPQALALADRLFPNRAPFVSPLDQF